jgi:hypothetical protein
VYSDAEGSEQEHNEHNDDPIDGKEAWEVIDSYFAEKVGFSATHTRNVARAVVPMHRVYVACECVVWEGGGS